MKGICLIYLSNIYKFRNVLKTLILNEIKIRYANTIFGYAWIFLYPTIFLTLYAVVYLFIFKVRITSLTPYEYVLMIFSALIPFLTISESLSRGVHLITGNANIIKITNFPLELIGLQIVLTSQIIQIVGFTELIVLLFFLKKITLKIFLVPILWFFQVVFSLGLVYFFATLNVFYRDISNIIPLLIIFLMMISPIAYTESMIPESLRIVLYLNPLYYLLIVYQQIFAIHHEINFSYILIFCFISLLMLCIGLYVFYKLKPIFKDYI